VRTPQWGGVRLFDYSINIFVAGDARVSWGLNECDEDGIRIGDR